MRQINKIMIFILAVVAAAILYKITSFIFDKAIVRLEPEYTSAALGAFFGALAAFLMLGFQKLITHKYERNRRHRNALVGHERLLNECLALSSDNILMLNDFVDSMEQGALGMTDFVPLPIDRQVLMDVACIDYINDVFELNIDIHKTNHSLNSIAKIYSEIKDRVYEPSAAGVEYFKKVLSNNLLSHTKDLKLAIMELDKKCEVIFSKNKALFSLSEPSYEWIFKFLSPKSDYPRGFRKAWEEQLKNLKDERSKMVIKSQAEIDARNRAAN